MVCYRVILIRIFGYFNVANAKPIYFTLGNFTGNARENKIMYLETTKLSALTPP